MKSISAPAGSWPPQRLLNDDTPASINSLLVIGELQLPWMIFSRSSHTLPDSGEADGANLLVVGVTHLQAAVFHVRPRVGVAGILVAVLSGHHGVAPERAHLPEEPQLVALDRAAHREAGVPVLDEARDFAEAVAA